MSKAIFFASDFHLGLDTAEQTSQEREKKIIQWMSSILEEAEALYLLGDLFDYWFEYTAVIPKGYVRFLAKIAEFTDRGIPVHVFTGNHDMWMFDYLVTELGVQLHRQPIEVTLHHKRFLLGHGDGLGPGDHGYKFIKKVFASPINQWLYARLHPNLGVPLMKYFSQQSSDKQNDHFAGPEKEWLTIYAEERLRDEHFDYFIFGHRHLTIDHTLSNGRSRYLNCGDWLSYDSYIKYDQTGLKLLTYSP